MEVVTAIDVAASFGLDPKRLRQALRDENLRWHRVKHARWLAEKGSLEEADMTRVARRLAASC
jgi:hypothetical protein